MKPFSMSEYCNEWLQAFRTMLPGGSAATAKDPTPKQAQVAANQEWEHEGGSIKPEKTPENPPPAKLPL